MRSEVDISIVVSIAAALVLFSLVLSAVALSRITLHDSKPQASWDDHFALDYWGAAV